MHTFSGGLDPVVMGQSSSLPHVAPERQMFSSVHDHVSVMIDPFVGKDIQQRWIEPNTARLSSVD
jgi:hypothetical protein